MWGNLLSLLLGKRNRTKRVSPICRIKFIAFLLMTLLIMGCNTNESLMGEERAEQTRVPIAIGVMAGEQYSNFCNFMLENDAYLFNPRQPHTWKFIFTRFASGAEAKMIINGRLRTLQLAEIRDQFEKFTVRDEPTISVELIKSKTNNTINHMEYHGQLTIRQFTEQLSFDVVGSCHV